MNSSQLLTSPELQSAYFASIVDNSDDAIVGKDLNSIVTSWNAGAERIFGYTEDEMIGKSIAILIPRERLAEEDHILSRIRAGDRVDHFETVRIRKDGREIHVSVTVSAIKNAVGEVVGASKIARDITVLKQLERERVHMLEIERTLREKAEKADRIKDEFLATLSHELRTPLSAILGWLEILRSGTPSPEDLREGLEVIHRNSHAQSQLVEDLLESNRILMGKVRLDAQLVDLATVVAASIKAVTPSVEAKGLFLTTELDSRAGPVRGDPARLQQVIYNLLTNAIKFTPAGGSIHVSLAYTNSDVEISVADTGIGIAPQKLEMIFDRFSQLDSSTTRRYSGLGLGLSIVKYLVELQGGSVTAESPGEGQGSTFRVRLPRARSMQADPGVVRRREDTLALSTAVEWAQPNLSGKSALIVDDDLDNAGVLKRLLEQCGAEATLAANGEAALELLRTTNFDVMISDVGMPDMDGFELIRLVRALPPNSGGRIPSIALTAFNRPEDRKLAIISGFDVYLAKPTDSQELLSIVERFVFRHA